MPCILVGIPVTHCKDTKPATARGHFLYHQSNLLLRHHLNPSPLHHLLWSHRPHHCHQESQNPHPDPQDHHCQMAAGACTDRKQSHENNLTQFENAPLRRKATSQATEGLKACLWVGLKACLWVFELSMFVTSTLTHWHLAVVCKKGNLLLKSFYMLSYKSTS